MKNLTDIYNDIYFELFTNTIKNQKDSSLQLDSGLQGKGLEMAIRAVLNPNSKNLKKVMSNHSTDIFLIQKGILLEVKTGCSVISYSNEVKDSLKYSNNIAYIPEIIEGTILEQEVKIVPKKDFLSFLFSNPTLYRTGKRTTNSYTGKEDSEVIAIQSFYSQGRLKASRKSRKLLDTFLNTYPSFQEFCESI